MLPFWITINMSWQVQQHFNSNMVDKCILKDTKIFECFSMHLGVFIVYFNVLVVYLDVIQCIYSIYFNIIY
jgi:hypothetical protein